MRFSSAIVPSLIPKGYLARAQRMMAMASTQGFRPMMLLENMPVENVKEIVSHSHHFEREISNAVDTVAVVATSYGLKLIGAIIILAVGWIVATWLRRILIRMGYRTNRLDMTMVRFLASLAKYFIIAFTVIAVLGNFGVQTASVVAVMGAAGLAIGLALQGTLSHFAAGFMLVLFRPFRVGDSIETAGVSGTVREINLFSTEIVSADNVRIIIPNNAVWSGVTKNLTASGTRRVELEIPIPYGSDVNAAIDLVKQVVAQDNRVLKEPPLVVGVSKFADANIKLTVQFWTASRDMGTAQLALSTALKDQLSKAGLLAK
jgi:small conductance mechanosensitive channel